MSFHRKKQSCESLMFMYDMTLRKLWLLEAFLEKVIQLKWFGTLTNFSSSSFDRLGIDQIQDHGSS